MFDDYDLGSKNQKGTVETRYGSREKLERCVAVMRANGIDVYADIIENDRDGDPGDFNRDKMLAYASMLTSESYPCVFYRDYSTDANCFGLKQPIDRIIWIHEHLASGGTQQRWKDDGVFAFERLGMPGAPKHLLVGLNKDSNNARTISVQSGFSQNTQLEDFAGHSGPITTDSRGNLTLTIPKCTNGTGYVCYSQAEQISRFNVISVVTIQDYDGAHDLDIAGAIDGQQVRV